VVRFADGSPLQPRPQPRFTTKTHQAAAGTEGAPTTCAGHATMKNVTLIGDSIRIGYQPTVAAELKDLAHVWGPDENSGTSANVLAHLDDWVISRPPRVVHINAGLHDIVRQRGVRKPAVPPAQYRANLQKIFYRIENETDAVVIWAATTPVNDARHRAVKEFDRFDADVQAYNRIAAEVAGGRGIRVNYLYEVVMGAGRDQLLVADGVHFTPEGYTLLGTIVAHIIREYL